MHLKTGLVPKEMEDKWFIYYEHPRLFFHRSWTGQPVYRLTLNPTLKGTEVTEALCSPDLAAALNPDLNYQSNPLLGTLKAIPYAPGGEGTDAGNLSASHLWHWLRRNFQRIPKLGRDVALKLLAHGALDKVSPGHLLREAQMASSLSNPNICTIHHVGEAGNDFYVVMELIEGQSLSDFGPCP